MLGLQSFTFPKDKGQNNLGQSSTHQENRCQGRKGQYPFCTHFAVSQSV